MFDFRVQFAKNDKFSMPGFMDYDYVKIDEHLRASGFQRSALEFNLYIKKSAKGISVFVIYVDNVIITGSGTSVIYDVREDKKKHLR